MLEKLDELILLLTFSRFLPAIYLDNAWMLWHKHINHTRSNINYSCTNNHKTRKTTEPSFISTSIHPKHILSQKKKYLYNVDILSPLNQVLFSPRFRYFTFTYHVHREIYFVIGSKDRKGDCNNEENIAWMIQTCIIARFLPGKNRENFSNNYFCKLLETIALERKKSNYGTLILYIKEYLAHLFIWKANDVPIRTFVQNNPVTLPDDVIIVYTVYSPPASIQVHQIWKFGMSVMRNFEFFTKSR